jgi:hypothetical protein
MVLAQMNSVASIVSPSGITITAGPGSMIIARPAARTLKPITATIKRLACPIVLRIKCFTVDPLPKCKILKQLIL